MAVGMKPVSDAITEVKRELGNRFQVPFGGYIVHTKRILRLFRMWEIEDDSPKWKTVVITTITTVLLTCNLLLGLSELTRLRHAPDLPTVASGVGGFWLHLIGFFKWSYFMWNVSYFMELAKQLEECYNLSLGMSSSYEGSPKLREEMKFAQKNSVVFMYVWTIFVVYGVIHWCMNPLILQWGFGATDTNFTENERSLPYETWIPWDTEESFGYWYAYLFEFVGSFASCVGNISYDVFYITLITMICAQFRYLHYVLNADRGTSILEKRRSKLNCFVLKEKLQRIKIYHDAILKFLANFEKLTSPVMFVECIGIIGILCLVSFEAMTMKLKGDIKNTIKVWSMMEYIFACFGQLFAFCYYASNVTALGLRVADAAYSCGWESMTNDNETSGDVTSHEKQKRDRKAVGFLTLEIIMRAQKPVHLTGGPFYILSLETYRAVVGAAFSYSTVLREFGEK